ncbi:hypothetical protein AMECASPLE_033256 [Ameca splendens]|uniref:Uncharacterized protein n=1 Tax=Ameca splendens TaxID=208324 RepID=A0ABV1A3S6_9TELE
MNNPKSQTVVEGAGCPSPGRKVIVHNSQVFLAGSGEKQTRLVQAQVRLTKFLWLGDYHLGYNTQATKDWWQAPKYSSLVCTISQRSGTPVEESAVAPGGPLVDKRLEWLRLS